MLTDWALVAGLCVAGAVAPGPSLLVVARRSVRSGLAAGLVCAWAHAVGIGGYAMVSLAGAAVLIARHPAVGTVASLAGALYLGWLGTCSLRARPTSPGTERTARRGIAAAAREGLVTVFLNPKVAAFFLAVFAPAVSGGPGLGALALLALTPFLIDGIWYTIVALTARRLGERGPVAGVVLERGVGLLLLLAAMAIAVKALVSL